MPFVFLQEQEALINIIDKLLDAGQVTQSRLLVEQFGVRSQNLEIVLVSLPRTNPLSSLI